MTHPLSDYPHERLMEWGIKQILYGKARYLDAGFLKQVLETYARYGDEMLLKNVDREELHHRIKHEPFKHYLGVDYVLPQALVFAAKDEDYPWQNGR